MSQAQAIKDLILLGIPDAQVQVVDPDGHHFEIAVASKAFKNKSLVEQHRLVYKALGNVFEGPVHAVQIKTSVINED
ncbi:MAG: BolA/IbaG family iron-sulfur metabolism protein [Deltaproteobacteria bacterium]|nr:BolA/IbaG family iron-sulfur metabolism protein [Deltaproteobacteria bacterium]